MAKSRLRNLQRLWRNLHLCIGAGLLLLLGSIAISGALLVWKAPLDAIFNPSRYAITPGEPQPPSVFVASVAKTGLEPVAIQLDPAGRAIVVIARRGAPAGARPNFMTVYLDPPTGRVLDVVDNRTSFFGLLHRFHENLTIPEYDGRSIVGAMGIAMLISVLSGIYLWWPRRGGIRHGLRWQRGPGVLSNLHHQIGIWIAIPLGVVALTGTYLGFPQQGRSLLSAVFAMTPAERGGFAAPLLRPTALNVDQALSAALAIVPGARPVTIALPTKQQTAWRIELVAPRTGVSATAIVDDASGAARLAGPRLPGDRIAAWLRWIHEGSHAGRVWRIIVFLCGLAPPVLGLSGVIVWLQRRRLRRREPLPGIQPELGPAE